jgi:rhomboid protease GluP
MPNCISCGRELPPTGDPQNICPECRAAILARSPSQNPLPARRSVMLERMPITSAIIGVNLLVFVAMALSGVSVVDPQNADLWRWGANTGLQTLLFQPWRMLTSNYVHVGLIHLLLNMWCLFNLGALAEQIFDRWTYFLTYTFCGLAGSLASVGLHPTRMGAGASGAIFGLAGALISALYLGHLPVQPRALKSILKSLVTFAAYNLFFGAVVPAIDNTAHIGGLVSGLALGAVLAPRLTSPRDERNSWRRWVFIVAGVVFVLAFEFARRLMLHKFGQQITP